MPQKAIAAEGGEKEVGALPGALPRRHSLGFPRSRIREADFTCLVTTVRAVLLVGMLSPMPAQAQGRDMSVPGASTAAPHDQAGDPSARTPAAELPGPRRDRPDQAVGPAKAEPDAARFGESAPLRDGAEPEKLCAALTSGTATAPAWQRSALPDESWECFAERVFAAEEGGGSVFAILRGRAESGVDGLRLKLNLPDDAAGAKAQQAAEEILQAVFAALDRDLPQALRAALAEHVPLRQETGGMVMELRREFGPVPRYNVMVDFAASPAKR
ncbi:DUF6030 family protein [Aureimonas glaciei]|uniref:Uncharacterized protein n=1 Tax=Aureimonas glaciei TaxID=1776957 RepID=A0A916Y644_9HYPH|nr:DUF6030 family protein [Aureimonas glaciei]GGD31942.1 hypothetical protein GCM10011335_38760 [Aureimonas glaciei]